MFATPNLALLLLYGTIGTIEDFIVSLFYRAIAEKRAARSAGISFIHTLLTLFVVASIIISGNFWLLLAYSIGGAVGTYCGVSNNRRKR